MLGVAGLGLLALAVSVTTFDEQSLGRWSVGGAVRQTVPSRTPGPVHLPLVVQQPTVTPTVAPGQVPFPVITQGTKLGVHSLSSGEIISLLQQALDGGTTLPVVKAVDNMRWLETVKEMSPNTITIGRVTGSGENVDDDELRSGDLRNIAERMMGHLSVSVGEHGSYVDYWEPTNELDPPGVELYTRFAELHFHLMDIAEQEGFKITLFTFNAGTPEWDEMVAIVETGVFGRAKEGGHILALHEGVGFGVGPVPPREQPIDYYWGETIPGSPIVEGAGALCFRYRYIYSLLEERAEVIPLVVTEFYPGGGHSQDGTTPEEVVQRVAWYDSETRKDYYTWGFLPFTLGTYPGVWEDSSYRWAYPALMEYAIATKDEANAVSGGGP